MWLMISLSGKKSVTAASDSISFSLRGPKNFKVPDLMYLAGVQWGL